MCDERSCPSPRPQLTDRCRNAQARYWQTRRQNQLASAEWGPRARNSPVDSNGRNRIISKNLMAQEPQSPSTSLVRRLSLTDSVLVLAGGIIGSGIFLTAKDIAQNVRHPALFILIWIAGLLITLLACFALAELGAMFPHAGGQYIYLREAYGEFVAFLYGWMIFTVGVSGTIAALGAGFSEYLGSVFPALAADAPFVHMGTWALSRGHAVSMVAIVLLTAFNVFGVRCGAILQNVATWTKIAAIAAFVILGIAIGHGSWAHYSTS